MSVKINWLTHLWIPLVTQWVSSYSALWAQAQAQARAQAQKVSTGLTRVYRGLYSAVLEFPKPNYVFWNFRGSAIDYTGLVLHLVSSSTNLVPTLGSTYKFIS